MRRLRVYISGPITKGDKVHNFAKAAVAHELLIRRGFAPLNPMLAFNRHMYILPSEANALKLNVEMRGTGAYRLREYLPDSRAVFDKNPDWYDADKVDVIVDVRPGSPTYLQHITVELTADNRRAAYLPPLSAHGYQTLTDDAEVTYQVSEFYTPSAERSLRYNDPTIAVAWPLEVTVISAKDAAAPLAADMEGPTT